MFDYFESSVSQEEISFSPKAVSKHSLERIVKAACTYASPRSNSWLKCVTNKAIINKLAASAHNSPIVKDAPALIVYFDDFDLNLDQADELQLTQINDHEASHGYASLAVGSAGMASTLVTRFDAKLVSKALGMPSDMRPRSILCLGYQHNA